MAYNECIAKDTPASTVTGALMAAAHLLVNPPPDPTGGALYYHSTAIRPRGADNDRCSGARGDGGWSLSGPWRGLLVGRRDRDIEVQHILARAQSRVERDSGRVAEIGLNEDDVGSARRSDALQL